MEPKQKKFLGIAALAALVGGIVAFSSKASAKKPAPAPEPVYDTGGQPAVIPTGGATLQFPQRGEGLTQMAQRLYGAGFEYVFAWVYDLNRGKIGGNPNRIEYGVGLYFPTMQSIQQAPRAAIDDFKRRYALMRQEFALACTKASFPNGTGTRNCGVDALIPLSSGVTRPTVVPKGADGSVYTYEVR